MRINQAPPYLLLAGVLAAACSGAIERTMPAFPSEAPRLSENDRAAISDLLSRFYGARTAAEADEVLTEAAAVAPDAPETHEMASRMALLRGDETEAWRHLYLALASPDDAAAYPHMLELLGIPMTISQYRETCALFQDIAKAHPDEGLRRVAAAYVSSWLRRLYADPEAAEAALESRGLLDRFALINPFDNDDGKGFATEYPPEREIDYDKEYPGTHFPARWRVDVPLDHQHDLDLRDLVSPVSWTTAYASTFVRVPEEREYLIRVTTTDPVRLWVNDIQVLSEQVVEESAADQFVFPVMLREGWNKLLAKSCHGRGSWLLGIGVTEADGRLVDGLESSSGPEEVAPGPPPGDGYLFAEDVKRRLASIDEPLRHLHLAVLLAESHGLATEALDLSDAYLSMAPDGLFPRLESAMTSWESGERGTTIDILDQLIEENGDDAPRLRVLRASFFEEQGRRDREREDLVAAIRIAPAYRTARLSLADNYKAEGWAEDDLKARAADAEEWPGDTRMLWGLAAAYRSLGRLPESEEVYGRILDGWRGAKDILETMSATALKRDDYRRAIEHQGAVCDIYPNSPACYLDLGDILRRAGRDEEALESYERCRAIDDRWAAPIARMGAMAYERGDEKAAVSLWKEALTYNPDDHSLADRIEFVAPSDAGLLSAYVPSKATVERVLESRFDTEVHPGANLVFLLDHAVEAVESDGSGRQVVTQVIMAVNDTGRDQITQYSFPPGRLKVKEAYVIDPDGKRREASSLRGRDVRFRELKTGSTVVLQFRLDTSPTGYLARYLYRRWFFHGVGSQFEDSKYVLIAPEDMPLGEWGQGSWKRLERTREDRRIVTYRARRVPPLVGEPAAPPMINLLDQVVVSSVPDWSSIAEWDSALLVDAFRSTPETRDLAERLTADAGTDREKLDALARFVMREIRYQQDYEETISGVKPHPASIVLQRGYGDCKDKSVLLMTLAKEVGIETRFAILRSTGTGDFVKDLPFLQFNHAVVHVPEQEGFPKPLFVDPTPDTLDLAALRPDVQGTWAMVIDPKDGSWEFVEIPIRPAEEQYTIRKMRVAPSVDDSDSSVSLEFVFQGPTAASVRRVLRNPDDAQVFISQMITQLFPGARLESLEFEGEDDIVEPLRLTIALLSDRITRPQGDAIVVDMPRTENISSYVSLEERALPLQTGLYLSLIENEDTVAIPEGYRVKHMPSDARIDTPFFSFERKSEMEGDELVITLRYCEKTTRISPDDYPLFRERVAEVLDSLEQDVIIEKEPPERAAGRGGKAGRGRRGER